MATTEKYNGWKNYETWSVNLILTNSEHTDTWTKEQAEEAWENAEAEGVNSKSEEARYALADTIKDEVEGAMTEGSATDILNKLGDPWSYLATQLLGAALSEVDWDELADAFLNDCEGYESNRDA